MDYPSINWIAFPADEQEAARLLSTALVMLGFQVDKFEHALMLADYCDQQRAGPEAELDHSAPDFFGRMRAQMDETMRWANWIQVAARDAAISLYNFAEVKQSITGLIGQCKTIEPHINRQELGRGHALFERGFPTYAHIRFSVAHAGKPFASPEKLQKHAVPGMPMIIGTLMNRTLQSTVNGKHASFDLTQESVNILRDVTTAIYRGFSPPPGTSGRRSLRPQ